MPFIRFVVANRHPDSGLEAGLFEVAYRLRDMPDVASDEREALREHLAWFVKQLSIPDRFNRTRSKGYYRRNARGIAWFRDSAAECIRRMHEMKKILEINGHAVSVIHEDRIGYVVYEDELQVVAEPFAETRTGP